MSKTYAIACTQCKKSLWVGQAWHPEDPKDRVFYRGEPATMKALGNFLFDHLGHPLTFNDDDNSEIAGYEQIDPDAL